MHPTSPSRKKIGIITGSGPEAGIDLWNKLLRANREHLGAAFRGDLDAPQVTIVSEPTLGLSMELETHDRQVWKALQSAARDIAARVDYYAIACNTLNYYQPQLDALGLPAKLISFADTARDFLQEQGIEQVALLGARPVTDLGDWSHYRKLAAHVRVELPAAEHAVQLHQLIYDVKTFGGAAPGIAARFETILRSLQSRTVLLACTELPLIPPVASDKQLVDVTALVANKLAHLAHAAA